VHVSLGRMLDLRLFETAPRIKSRLIFSSTMPGNRKVGGTATETKRPKLLPGTHDAQVQLHLLLQMT
jgi:hypothetical protein